MNVTEFDEKCTSGTVSTLKHQTCCKCHCNSLLVKVKGRIKVVPRRLGFRFCKLQHVLKLLHLFKCTNGGHTAERKEERRKERSKQIYSLFDIRVIVFLLYCGDDNNDNCCYGCCNCRHLFKLSVIN